MSSLLTSIQALCESMRTADGSEDGSFARVFEEFFTLGETTELLSASKPSNDKGIRTLLGAVACRHTNDPEVEVRSLHMLQHAATNLFHGGFFAGQSAVTFFYFVKEQQGLAAFHAGGSRMDYYRITAAELPAGASIGRKRGFRN